MNRPRWKHFLKESGLCVDSPILLDWLLKNETRKIVAFRFLRLRFSPTILSNTLAMKISLKKKANLFSLSISHINVRDIYKTTSSNRTALADKVIMQLAKKIGPLNVMDIGVSDGSSVRALLKNNNLFSSIRLTDRYNIFYEKTFPLGRIFLDSNARLLGVKFLCFYCNLASDRILDTSTFSTIKTINPQLSKEAGIRSIERFDITRDISSPPVDLIKCANVLNIGYFEDKQILAILENLKNSLNDEGHLVISQNNDKYRDGEAVLLLRKKHGRYTLERSLNDHDLTPLLQKALS